MRDVIIVGAGTAGLTAAIYTVRDGMDTLVLEGLVPGGQIVNTSDIENYPGLYLVNGPEFSQKITEQAKVLGTEILSENVKKIERKEDGTFLVTTGKNEHAARTVIYAAGCKPKKMGCPEEDSYVGRGVSYCAHCDGNFFRGKDVAVVGGGNTALEDALFLSNIANKVYLIHRREEFRAAKKEVDLLRSKENVEFCLNKVVDGLSGDPMLSEVRIKDTQTGDISTLSVNGIFVAIGQIPETNVVKDLVPLDDFGYIPAGEECKTDIPGFYVAGDLRTKSLRQLVTAASDGANAAVSATHYLLS